MSAGRVRHATGSWRSALPLAVLAYAVVLAASPLLHHDLTCELKSRTHCTTCVSGVAGPGLATPAGPMLPDAPRVVTIASAADTAISAISDHSINGRAPPAA